VSEYNGLYDGIRIGPAKYYFGAISPGAGAGYETQVNVEDLGASAWFSTNYPLPLGCEFGLNGADQAIIAKGLDTTTAGTSSGKYLRVKIGTTFYKLELLADA
jgi:hypothetical protein